MSISTYQKPPNVLKLIAHAIRWKLLSALAYSDYRVHELSALVQKPVNLVSYHLRLLRRESILRERRSSADARDVYYGLDLERFHTLYRSAAESLHPALSDGHPESSNQPSTIRRQPTRVLFLCTHNSARSQIAEALLRHLGGDRVEVFSAGTEASRVHPKALEILQRNGIDTTGLYSKPLDGFVGRHFDYVITVCDHARESCPIFPGDPERIHWSFPDPSSVPTPDEQHIAFLELFAGLEKRLKLLLAIIGRDQNEV
jgi:protein-tyrosine-phosphatase